MCGLTHHTVHIGLRVPITQYITFGLTWFSSYSDLRFPITSYYPHKKCMNYKNKVLELPIAVKPGNRTIPLSKSEMQFPGTWIIPVRESGN